MNFVYLLEKRLHAMLSSVEQGCYSDFIHDWRSPISGSVLSRSRDVEPFTPLEPRIPIELFRNIVEFCYDDTNTLLSLMFCSHFIKDEAERVLYNSIGSARVRHPIPLLQRILSSPRTAALVRHFSVTELSRRLGPGKVIPFRNLVVQILPMLTNLRSLDICCWDSTTVAALLSSPFKLRSLHIISWSADYEHEISALLTKQSDIEDLKFLSTSPLNIPLPALGKLKTLSATACSLETLLTGRSVEKVVWVGYPTSEKHVDAPSLAASLHNIRSLKLGAQSAPLESFVEYLDQLEDLELQEPSEQDLLCVPHLPRLKTLKLTGIEGDSFEQKTIDQLFCSKSLQQIDVTQEWVGERYQRRWYLGDKKPKDLL